MSYYEEAPYSQGQAEPFVQPAPRRGSAIASYTGAALSLSLLIGTGVWGYGIISIILTYSGNRCNFRALDE